MARFERPHDERPIPHARRVRDGDDTGHRPATSPGALGILSVVAGIISLVIAFIPCVGSLALLGGSIGLVLGGIGALVAGPHCHGKGVPIAGIVLNALSIAVSAAMVCLVWSIITAPDPQRQRVRNETAIPIGADRLADEYGADPLKADAAYKDKVVEVTGRVVSIESEYPSTVVTFGGGGITLRFRCERESHGQAIKPSEFTVGETLTIRCLCSGAGSTIKTSVDFRDCVVSRGPK